MALIAFFALVVNGNLPSIDIHLLGIRIMSVSYDDETVKRKSSGTMKLDGDGQNAHVIDRRLAKNH